MFEESKRKEEEIVPQPESSFIKIKCLDCGNQQVVFEKASTPVNCLVCGKLLLEPTGGKARVYGEFILKLE